MEVSIKIRHPFDTGNWYGPKETYTHKYDVVNILAKKDDKKMNSKNQTLIGAFIV